MKAVSEDRADKEEPERQKKVHKPRHESGNVSNIMSRGAMESVGSGNSP